MQELKHKCDCKVPSACPSRSRGARGLSCCFGGCGVGVPRAPGPVGAAHLWPWLTPPAGLLLSTSSPFFLPTLQRPLICLWEFLGGLSNFRALRILEKHTFLSSTCKEPDSANPGQGLGICRWDDSG